MTFHYDGAGRVLGDGQTAASILLGDAQALRGDGGAAPDPSATWAAEYDGADQMVRYGTANAGGGTYAYGYDGFRTLKEWQPGDGSLSREMWFAPNWAVRADGSQEVTIGIGDRLVARVRGAPDDTVSGALAAVTSGSLTGGDSPGNNADAKTITTASNASDSHAAPASRSAFADVGPVRWPAPDLSFTAASPGSVTWPGSPSGGPWTGWRRRYCVCSPCCLGCLVSSPPAWAGPTGPVCSNARGRRPAQGRRGVPAVAAVVAASMVLGLAGCGGSGAAGGGIGRTNLNFRTDRIIYVHHAVASGPVMFTDQAGNVWDERRYEPYGNEIDSRFLSEFNGLPADKDPQNNLNKETDLNTGLSYHGARWMAPTFARWLTPDPPVKVPDDGFMEAPWRTNPYAYVLGNPIVYWDPDGREEAWYVTASNFVSDTAKAVVSAPMKALATTVDFAAGVGAGVIGLDVGEGGKKGLAKPDGHSAGQVVGAIGGLAADGTAVTIGGGMAVGGGAATVTVGGAVVGVPAAAAGVALAGAGVVAVPLHMSALKKGYNGVVNGRRGGSGSGPKGGGGASHKVGGKVKTPSSPNKMQQEVRRGQAPKEIKRVDKPHVEGQEPHIHFCNGTSCNRSGSTHDAHRGTPNPGNKAREWLEGHGWTPPPR